MYVCIQVCIRENILCILYLQIIINQLLRFIYKNIYNIQYFFKLYILNTRQNIIVSEKYKQINNQVIRGIPIILFSVFGITLNSAVGVAKSTYCLNLSFLSYCPTFEKLHVGTVHHLARVDIGGLFSGTGNEAKRGVVSNGSVLMGNRVS